MSMTIVLAVLLLCVANYVSGATVPVSATPTIYSTARGRNAFFWCRQGFFITNKDLQMIICVLFMYMCQCFMGKT